MFAYKIQFAAIFDMLLGDRRWWGWWVKKGSFSLLSEVLGEFIYFF